MGQKPANPKHLFSIFFIQKIFLILQIYRDINQAVKTINRYLKRIAEDLKLEMVPTTNFARQSFSTILKPAGVPIEMISEQLGNTPIKTTQIYFVSFERDQKREIQNI